MGRRRFRLSIYTAYLMSRYRVRVMQVVKVLKGFNRAFLRLKSSAEVLVYIAAQGS